ncbi:myozenin-1-like [Brienomyrus brachyistius]|uniref:myozenin-1-like n=1 Tax=Brienomyrus brachyistius TaxID=42636 RepID=UPI0020B19D90|nr:myozenin-1-like [Brienomyrus brachyistius]
MPLSGTPGPNKRKKSSRIITDLSLITQEERETEPDASTLDLGKKIRAPKDIMLEELSLLKNKGSKMFRMRQQRVEKFVYENNPDLFSSESMENFQKLVPTLGGQMMDVGGHIYGQTVSRIGRHGQAPIPPPKPGSLAKGAFSGGAGGTMGVVGSTLGTGGARGFAGGAVGEGLEEKGEGDSQQDHGGALIKSKKKCELVKTYMSPWERAMKGDTELTATMKIQMPGPITQKDVPMYKCFNRSAMPYGGFEKASQLMTFQLPEIEAAVEDLEPPVVYHHDIGSRPSFNRTPIGWVGSGETGHIQMELDTIPFDGETDDL